MFVRVVPLILIAAVAHAESKVPIPEPMVFDLVRPLGARRGELEVNTLAQRTHRAGAPWTWAPEVEYAFSDGYSAEIEFPFEDGSLRQYKAALQGTFGVAAGERYIHGWQAIGRLERGGSAWSGDMLYLAGYRINHRWSIFTMQGARRSRPQAGLPQWAGILNPSAFRTLNHRWTLGLETNLVLAGSRAGQQLVMPQVQVHVGQGWIFQAGAGIERTALTATRPAFGMRLTRVLR